MVEQESITQSVEQFLRQFDNDPNKALAALKQYVARSTKQPANTVLKKSRGPRRPLSSEVVIRVKDLKKTYTLGKTQLNALAGVSLDIHKGEFLALTGASGSGKSTLLQLIGGLDKPTSGSVTINGTTLNDMSDQALSRFRNQTIGFVFQFFYLQPFLKLEKNLEVAAMPLGTPAVDRAKRVKELALAVGLSDRLGHYPKELSGGQMQRAAIARALLNNPKVILADEPTGNLDSENGQAVIELFEKIRDEFHTSIVIVTHDPAVASRADRVITLKDGVII